MKIWIGLMLVMPAIIIGGTAIGITAAEIGGRATAGIVFVIALCAAMLITGLHLLGAF